MRVVAPGPTMRPCGVRTPELLGRGGGVARARLASAGQSLPSNIGVCQCWRQRRLRTILWSLVFWCAPHPLHCYPANSSADDRFALAIVEARWLVGVGAMVLELCRGWIRPRGPLDQSNRASAAAVRRPVHYRIVARTVGHVASIALRRSRPGGIGQRSPRRPAHQQVRLAF